MLALEGGSQMRRIRPLKSRWMSLTAEHTEAIVSFDFFSGIPHGHHEREGGGGGPPLPGWLF